MRGLSPGLRQAPSAMVFLAGAMILAAATGAASAQPPSQGDEVALAVPRIRPPPGGLVALPRPLSAADADLVRRIFAAQRAGDTKRAAQQIQALRDHLLLGTVLANQYLRAPRTASPAALRTWLARYADLPEAASVQAIWRSRSPRGAQMAAGTTANDDALSPVFIPRVAAIAAQVARLPRWQSALARIASAPGLEPATRATLRAELARRLLGQGQNAAAAQVLAHGTEDAALGAYVAGLLAWQRGDIATATPLFARAWVRPDATPSLRAAAAFWAARAAQAGGIEGAYLPWLRRAASGPPGFYTLLARHQLGLESTPINTRDVLGPADIAALSALPGGERAFALLQVGQNDLAEAELRAIWESADPALARSVRLVAREAGLPDPAELGKAPARLPHLAPRGGFRVDPALLYALARVESNFNPHAVSPAGARGLLQLMPHTASRLAGHAQPAALLRQLHEPARNLQLGQMYLLRLADDTPVSGNLIRLLASYNAGPNAVRNWPNMASDPLLFIEIIPMRETRRFVRRTLTYSWQYADRLDVPAPSLDTLAAGDWPQFDGPASHARIASLGD